MHGLKSKFAMVLPVLAAAVLGLVLSNLTMGETRDASAQQASPFSDVERVMVATQPQSGGVEAAGGAGFNPAYMAGECDCDCLDEGDIRKIVQDEFDKQMRAERVAPRASIPGAAGYSSSANVSSAPVVSVSSSPVVSSPTVVHHSHGTTSVAVGSTCRTVNGRVVCDVPQASTVHVQTAPVRRGLFGRWRSR